MVKNDIWIKEMAAKGMINPFVDKQRVHKAVSFGVSSCGYDMRLSGEFKIFTSVWNSLINPKEFSEKSFVEVEHEDLGIGDNKDRFVIIPPNSFVLGRSLEYFKIPRDIIVICLGKSTYARCGVSVGITPLEPEWEGYVTIEIANTTPLPVKVYAYEGIAQLLFLEAHRCETSYADKKGKYQGQKGITLPKV